MKKKDYDRSFCKIRKDYHSHESANNTLKVCHILLHTKGAWVRPVFGSGHSLVNEFFNLGSMLPRNHIIVDGNGPN